MNNQVTTSHGLKLISVTLRNFMSYGNNTTVIRLDRPGTTFIVGQDMDSTTNGTSSNGTGKTTIINAIVFALYNRAISDDVTVDGLVNNINKKNMEVTLDFMVGSMCYRVVRARKMKSGPSGNYVMFYQKQGDFNFNEADDQSKGHSVYDTDGDIQRVIGMKFDMFTRIVIFSAMKESFFDLPLRTHGTSKKSNQTDFIEELFGLTELSKNAEDLKLEIKNTNKQLSDAKTQVEFQEREHKRYNDQLAAAELRVSRWAADRDNQVLSMEATLESYRDFDFDMELRLQDERQVRLVERAALLTKQKSLASSIRAALKIEHDKQDELNTLRAAKCPYCDQPFHDNRHKVDECEVAVKDAGAEMEQLQGDLSEVVERIAENAEKLDQVVPKFDTRELAIKTRDSVERGVSDIDRLVHAVNPFIEPLEELKAMAIPSPDYTRINQLTRLVEHQEFLHKLLTKKDSFVRRNLLNKNLPYLNTKLQEYLSALGLAHKVEFTHELTARITQFGRELAFGNLSAGQKARVNIALSFAFRDVLQSMHRHVNICMLDEILDVGLNSAGVTMAVHMLKNKARSEKLSMYVITHREEVDSMFDRTLAVQMSKGFSYVFTDDNAAAPTS